MFEDSSYSDETIKWDVLDQLWKLKTYGWGNGIRKYNLTVRPNSTRATSLNPAISSMEIGPERFIQLKIIIDI